MLASMRSRLRLEIHPLTARRFRDLESLFSGPDGSQVRECWCMLYRRSRTTEAYPIDRPARCPDESMWFGCKAMYDRAGFSEVARHKPSRPVIRKALRAKRG
jgi:hypothetical protein